MIKYDIFLFDADNTLYDFDKASAHALQVLFDEYGYAYNAQVPKQLAAISAPFWKRYERGEMSDKDLQKQRFERLFEALGITHDPVAFNERYLHALGKSPFLIDGAEDICRKIAESNKLLYIVTNGFLTAQMSRLQHSPFSQYVSDAFVSEVVGHKKPSREYFDHVLARIPPVKKDKILMVGDSLTADVAGGNGAGIDSCWFNLRSIKNQTNIAPTYEIRKLRELERFV